MTTSSLVPSGTGIPSGGGGGPVTSFYSSLSGPSLSARSWTWETAYTAVTVGTVLVTVDENTNRTETTTVYNTQHVQYITDGSFNGSLLHSRTNVDAQGTVTSVVWDGEISSSVTLTYPTNYLEVAGSSLIWDAILPTFAANASCCQPTTTLAPTPAQAITTSTASTLSNDPSGWLYDLVAVSLYPSGVSEIWSGQTLGLDYSGCPFTMCPNIKSTPTASEPPSYTWQNPQAYLLATSTTTLSSVGNGGGGGTTTMPQPGNQGPPGITTTPTAVPDQNSQGGNGPTSSPGGDMPSGETSDVVPTQQQQPPPSGNGQPPPMNMPPPIVIGPSTVTPNSASQYVVGDQTLAPGSAIEVSGTPYSLPSGGSQVVVGTVTSDLMPGITSPPAGGLPPFLTWADSVVTPNSNSEYVIDGRTLVGGSAITVSGTPVSLPSGASQLVVGDVTSSVSSSPAITTSSAGSGPQSPLPSSSSSPSSSSGSAASDQNAASRSIGISARNIVMFLTALMLLNL